MTAQEVLLRAGDLQEELTCKLAHLRCLRARVSGGGARLMPARHAQGDRTGDTACMADELERDIQALYRRIDSARREAALLIKRLPSARMRSLLDMRYLTRLTWEETAEALDISPRAAYRLHQRALRMLSVFIPQS